MDKETFKKKNFPIPTEVEAGQSYLWCSCGQSQNQPFCDKADCGKKAVAYTAELTETLYFCNCKKTQRPPLCDGSHSQALFEFLRNEKNQT